MGSRSTRADIVSRALQLSGRGQELKLLGNALLNDKLRSCALKFKYKPLMAIGSALTLNMGLSTSALPSDYGAGMANLLFGDKKKPLEERELDEFIDNNGFKGISNANGEPTFYYVDKNGSNFVFNYSADQNYSFIPIYYQMSPVYAEDGTGDNLTVWYEDDDALVQLLIHRFYQYLGDSREQYQAGVAEKADADYRRGIAPNQGGSARIRLSRSTFRPRNWR